MHLDGHDRCEYCAQFRLSLLNETADGANYPCPFDNVKRINYETRSV